MSKKQVNLTGAQKLELMLPLESGALVVCVFEEWGGEKQCLTCSKSAVAEVYCSEHA